MKLKIICKMNALLKFKSMIRFTAIYKILIMERFFYLNQI